MGIEGGLNLYTYAPNPLTWIDPWGLAKYVVYLAPDFDNPGKLYTGRTSGSDEQSIDKILRKRKSSHHRNLGSMRSVFETDSYDAVRGAEQIHKDRLEREGKATTQIEPISKRNRKRAQYINCAKSKGV